MTYLTLEQVSEQTHAPIATVRWWIHTHKLPAFKPGRYLLVKQTDLTAFIESASIASRGAAKARRVRAARKVSAP